MFGACLVLGVDFACAQQSEIDAFQNVISKQPKHDFGITGNLQIGDYNLKHFDGAVNFPISDAWAARVAILRESRDGYLSSGDMDNNVLGTRTKLLYEPNEVFSVLATYEYFWERDHGSNTVPVPGSAGNLPRLGASPSFNYTKPDDRNFTKHRRRGMGLW